MRTWCNDEVSKLVAALVLEDVHWEKFGDSTKLYAPYVIDISWSIPGGADDGMTATEIQAHPDAEPEVFVTWEGSDGAMGWFHLMESQEDGVPFRACLAHLTVRGHVGTINVWPREQDGGTTYRYTQDSIPAFVSALTQFRVLVASLRSRRS